MNNELIIPSVDNSEVLVKRTSELLNDQAGAWFTLSRYESAEEFETAILEEFETADLNIVEANNVPYDFIVENRVTDDLFKILEKADTECASLEELFTMANELTYTITDLNTFEEACSFWESEYHGTFKDAEEFAREYVQSVVRVEEFIENYIDYEKMGDDLLYDYRSFELNNLVYVFHN